ncbi:hypothetical protein [Borrelia persica]|uniref:hypothetical protein n=1 Tax=Borrelia persica TaxID=44448 RepID=UPI000466042E|nr:hypothetical protein [Borrelia persica]
MLNKKDKRNILKSVDLTRKHFAILNVIELKSISRSHNWIFKTIDNLNISVNKIPTFKINTL